MRAMILAAGRGKRMRPLTDVLPKPLLMAGSRRLIDWPIDALVRAGITDVVINTAHLSDTFLPALGQSYRGARITYSVEGKNYDESLETLGGIAKALPLLSDGKEPFIVVAGDIATDFDFTTLLGEPAQRIRTGDALAHLVLVPNPDFHPEGHRGLFDEKVPRGNRSYTYSSIGLFSPSLFKEVPVVFSKLFPWFYRFIDEGRVTGEVFNGFWENVGTPDALEKLVQREAKSLNSSKKTQ